MRGASGRDARGALSRERVLRGAVELADRQGIDSLTMRALGSWLGVEAPSLYNHVRDKDDLLDGMTDLVVGEIELPGRTTFWKDAMRLRATSALDVFSRHPWASGLIDSRGSMGPARLAYVNGVLEALLGAGFSVEAAANAFMALDSYIYGFERQRTELNLGGGTDTTDAARAVQLAASPATYPALERVAREFAVRPFDVTASFAFGLDLLLDGLERRLASIAHT